MSNESVQHRISKFYQNIKYYLANTSWIMAEKIISIGVNFLITVLVARYLGPERYGILSYALSLVALLAVSGHVGLSGLVVRELVSQPNFNHEIMGTSFGLKSVGYVSGFILILVFIFVARDLNSDEFWILLILATTLLIQPVNVIEFWFQSRLEAKYTTIAKTTALIISSILKIALIYFGAHLIYFAVANTAQAFLVALALVLFYVKKSKLTLTSWRFSPEKAKILLSQGLIVYLGAIFAMIYLKVDQVMIKWLVDAEEVGIYAVAASLSEAWFFVPVAIVASFFPKLIKLRESGQAQFDKRLQQLFDLLLLISLVAAFITTLIAKPLIIYTFGEDYANSVPILLIHIWAALFIFMRAAFSKWILIENVLIFSLITQAFGASTNVMLNYWLIPIHGGEGAAYATLISYSVASYLALSLYSKTRKIFWMMTKSFLAPVRYIFKSR